MTRLRALVALAALIVVGGLVAVIPATAASAAACSASWQASAVYWGDAQVSHNGRNYRAKWWTQNEAPPGTTGVWEDLGACGGGTTPPTGGTCAYPNWTAGAWYATGAIVRYTNGLYYIAEHDNPGYDPIDQHLVLGALHLRRPTPDHPAAHQPGRLRGDRGPVQPDVPGSQLRSTRTPDSSRRSAPTRRSRAPAVPPSSGRRPRPSWRTCTTRPAGWCTSSSRTPPTTRTTATPASRTAAPPGRPPTTGGGRSSSAGTSTTTPRATPSTCRC